MKLISPWKKDSKPDRKDVDNYCWDNGYPPVVRGKLLEYLGLESSWVNVFGTLKMDIND